MLVPQVPEKIKLATKVVKINSKLIILRYESKSVIHSIPTFAFYVSRSWDQTITNTISWLLFSEFVVSSEEDMISLFRTRHWTRWEIAEWDDLFFQNCIESSKSNTKGEGVNDFVTTGNKTWNNGRREQKNSRNVWRHIGTTLLQTTFLFSILMLQN